MNRLLIGILSIALVGIVYVPSSAQQDQPPPPPDQQQQLPPGQDVGPGGGFGGPRGQFGPGRGPGGRGARGGPGAAGRGAATANGPELQKYQALRDYIDVVDHFTQLSQNPDSAGVAAVVSATDLLRQRGPESAIEYFTKTLPEVKSPTIQRAIRLQLVDLYKASGQSEKALEQLDVLMKP